jgi:hypothetical protein
LADVTQQLLRIESAPLSSGIPPQQLSRVINDSVGLISSLCDFLALQGDVSIVGKLYPCLELRHRRVQVEAAYALATLGEKAGQERLIALAEEPLVRRRVLAYCEPLGLSNQSRSGRERVGFKSIAPPESGPGPAFDATS